MTVSTTAAKAGPFTGNDVTSAYDFEFRVFADTDIRVVQTVIATGVESDLVLNTDYTVARNADQDSDPGGTITYKIAAVTAPLPSTKKLTIVGNYAYEQPANIPNGGKFYASVVEAALDRLTMLLKQLLERVNRAFTLPVSVTSDVSAELPLPEANKVFGWNETATALQNVDAATLASIVAYGTTTVDQFSGDGVTTAFVLSNNPGAINNLEVSVGGVMQRPDIDYSWNVGTILTFTTPPPSGANNILVRYALALPQGTMTATAVTAADGASGTLWSTVQGFINKLLSSAGAASVGFIQSGTGAVARTLQEEARERVSVSQFVGFDPTGATSSVAAFQAAIDSTPNTGVQVIHVPRGSYLGDMGTLDYGLRNVIWSEEAGVSYLTQYPDSTNSTTLSGQPSFAQGIFPAKHLRQFSARPASAGAGFVPGTVTITTGAITAVAVSAGGANYSSPRVLITGDGTGATATATITGGAVTSINITGGGTGYTTASVYVVEGPVVVVAGDSISTPNPSGSLQILDGQYDAICRAIRQQNQKRNVTFFNRAIGAQTWTTFNGVANSNLPSWYSNPAKNWLEYINELQPDLVILAFGMNDRQNFVPAQMRAAIQTINAWATPPDVVLCTNMVPSAISAEPNISSDASQIGRDFVAGYQRGYAIKNSLGFIDIHRQLRLIRDGQDHRHTPIKYYAVGAAQVLPYTFANQGEGVYLDATFDCSVAGFWTNRAIELMVAPPGVNMVEWIRVASNGTHLVVSVQEYSGAGVPFEQATYTTLIQTPVVAGTRFEVTVIDQTMTVFVNGVEAVTANFYKAGGAFAPVLRRVDITTPTLPVSISDTAPTVAGYGVGQYASYQPKLTDYQLWGYGPATGYGGNALNHPSTLCLKYVIAPPIYGANFASSPISFGVAAPSTSHFSGIGEPNPRALQHITKTRAASTLTPVSNANNQLLEDASSVGQSLMTMSTGVSRWVAGNELNNQAFVKAFAHSTGTYTWSYQGTTLLGLLNTGVFYPGTDNTQSLGTATKRWSVVYAGTGTINTSDGRDKQQIRDVEAAEKAVAIRCKSLLRAFKFTEAVERKGSGARIHFGVIAQDVIDAFREEGLDPFAYSIVCYDEWTETPELRDNDGFIIQERVEAGNKFGIRYDELFSFILCAS